VLAGLRDGLLVVVAEREGLGRSNAVPIPRGSASAQVDLVLGPTGSLEGRFMRDGQPFADTVVLASPAFGLANFFVRSGPDGRFALDVLRAGSYVLQGFLNRHKDMLVAPVTVEAGRRLTADLDLRTGSITLRVRVDTNERRPVTSGLVLLLSTLFEARPGENMETIRLRFRPTEPTKLAARPLRDVATFEALTPGVYTACAAPARKRGENDAPIWCASRTVSGDGELVVTIPDGAWPQP
jgi:hypothetical protein